tara:strand:- start:16309 stop:16902 length:594 start_codon:yes stop_codon:yes gene_type:complete
MLHNKVIKKIIGHNNPISRFSLRYIRDYRLRRFDKLDQKVLEVSGGSRPLFHDYLNVDVSEAPEVDLVTNLLDPIPLEDNTAHKIVSVATLEHFNVNDVRKILRDFNRLLKPGGEVEIGVPSIDKIFVQYKERGCDDVVLRYLHGGLKDQYDVHLFVVDSDRFIGELLLAGFKEAKEVEYDFPRHSGDFMMKVVAKK